MSLESIILDRLVVNWDTQFLQRKICAEVLSTKYKGNLEDRIPNYRLQSRHCHTITEHILLDPRKLRHLRKAKTVRTFETFARSGKQINGGFLLRCDSSLLPNPSHLAIRV